MCRIKFMNTEIDNLTMTETLLAIDELIQKNKNAYVVTPNVDHIVKLEKNEDLKNAYSEADLVLTDGKPLVWASRLYRNPIKEKISGSDLFPELCKLAAEKHYSMFFLGAKEGVAARAAENLKIQYPGLDVVGCYAPPWGFENDSAELDRIEKMIKDANPHILILALGCPKQEIFAHQFRNRFNVPVSLCLGATLDFSAGNVKRAPRWMANVGLEWLYRLCQEPKRMFKRYVLEDWKFAGLLFKYWGDAS
jgi:N-acetylglucosaminyldiphosphoundecaprenol N-acetyl-beta-D-mannosaminyltransferase